MATDIRVGVRKKSLRERLFGTSSKTSKYGGGETAIHHSHCCQCKCNSEGEETSGQP